jgi:hypothetical protein
MKVSSDLLHSRSLCDELARFTQMPSHEALDQDLAGVLVRRSCKDLGEIL